MDQLFEIFEFCCRLYVLRFKIRRVHVLDQSDAGVASPFRRRRAEGLAHRGRRGHRVMFVADDDVPRRPGWSLVKWNGNMYIKKHDETISYQLSHLEQGCWTSRPIVSTSVCTWKLNCRSLI